MEELQANLKNYQLQLQQVEAALLVDPENEELQKLRTDLQEVTNLTLDLVRTAALEADGDDEDAGGGEGEASGAGAESSGAGPSSSAPAVPEVVDPNSWKTGDRCVAMWAEDGKEYEATVEEILVDGTCTITFDGYGNTEVMQLTQLKAAPEGSQKRGVKRGHGHGTKMSKKDLIAQQRDYKKKKSQKKAARRKELEEERETDKNKWTSFNSKLFTKGGKGQMKKSIFASPEANSGKVGVGTCGVGGKPMTSYHQNEKWKKGAMN